MDASGIGDRIRFHVSSHYDELRRQMDAYQTVSEAFPDHLKGSKRIVAVLARDGVTVSHWAAEQDTFEFYHSDKSMVEIANEQTGGGFVFDFPPDTDLDIRAAGFAIYEGAGTSGPVKWKTP